MLCQDCKKPAQRKAATQKYCPDCSNVRQMDRQRVWAREHPSTARPETVQARKNALREQGVKRSAEVSRGMTWMADNDPDLQWLMRVRIPFDYGFSKNAIYRMLGVGHVALRQKTRRLRELLAELIRAQLRDSDIAPVDGKVWIDILVQKPDHKGDAVNVVDTVCDAIKDAIGVDDRWFCIRRLDWEVVKGDPSLMVGIGQEVTVPHRVCSYCGRILELTEHFPKRSRGADGYGRVCNPCQRVEHRVSAALARQEARRNPEQIGFKWN